MDNTIYIDDDYDLYCQFCEENIPSLEWKKHLELYQHLQTKSLCIDAITSKGLFCKDCGFLADKTWCRLANPGEEDLKLGKEFLSYTKEPIRSPKCILAEIGYSKKTFLCSPIQPAEYSITMGEVRNSGRSRWQPE